MFPESVCLIADGGQVRGDINDLRNITSRMCPASGFINERPTIVNESVTDVVTDDDLGDMPKRIGWVAFSFAQWISPKHPNDEGKFVTLSLSLNQETKNYVEYCEYSHC